jgi:hypothetical protein
MLKLPKEINDIRLLSFSNGQWLNPEKTMVRGMLQWNTMDEPQLSAVDLTEDYQHIQNLKQRIEAGEFGEIAGYTPPTQDEINEVASQEAVIKRRDLLAETDWWAMSDRTMTQEEIDYRQALRDVTDQAGYPIDITWPTKP